MNINKKYMIGLRAVKTAVAISLCLLISLLFNRADALYSTIAALICMQQTYSKTFKSGLERFIGTILGGIFGFFILQIICSISWYSNWLDVIVVPFCILLVIYICNMFNKQPSVVIGCIVLISIVAQPEKNLDDTLIYVINRIIDTTIGIVIAMFVNKFLFPKKSVNHSISNDNFAKGDKDA